MKLPSYQQLSKEQDAINDLPLEGSYLITGPPGTGKTVMALYRTQMLTKSAASVQLLMYSRLLSQYVQSAVDHLDLDGSVNTFHSWFYSFYREVYRNAPPQLEKWVYEWSQILTTVTKTPPSRMKMPFLIVDEGQDLPRDFYVVAEHLAKHVTVFADENQKLTKHNSTLSDIRLYSGINGNVYELRRNYRNTKEIAMLAQHFCVDQGFKLPEAPERTNRKPEVRAHATLDETIRFIRTTAKNNSDVQIGIFTPTRRVQSDIYRRLSRQQLPIPIHLYVGGRGRTAPPLDFDDPGIYIVNYQSAKGLEFDIVILPELQTVALDIRAPEARMLFYVLISRARNELYLCYSGVDEPPVVAALPAALVKKS